MKKTFYIAAFTFLGILVSFLIHAVVEIPVIFLLIYDIERLGLGFSWADWIVIHNVWSVALLVIGIAVGFQQGRHWWHVVYIRNKSKTSTP